MFDFMDIKGNKEKTYLHILKTYPRAPKVNISRKKDEVNCAGANCRKRLPKSEMNEVTYETTTSTNWRCDACYDKLLKYRGKMR